jgi:methylthioribose-1-phosphate isomerase
VQPRRSSQRSLEFDAAAGCVRIIDQTRLPGEVILRELRDLDAFCEAIRSMRVRGAPLIGVTGAYGLALSIGPEPTLEALHAARDKLTATRPTAVNLHWALTRVCDCLSGHSPDRWQALALVESARIAEEDIEACRRIGEQGLAVLQALAADKTGPVNVLTHCNAGRLATLEWGTATAPVYAAHARGVAVHVWVSETRPRNQGASLTAWELDEAGVPFTVIADNAAGALMQSGQVDCVMVGSDRTAANGDVCNKIGTYPKALLAREHGVPFYALLPLSTIDRDCSDGSAILIEERAPEEVLELQVVAEGGEPRSLALSVAGASAWNPAFDVTPAELVTGIITEQGQVPATPEGIASLR